MTPCRRLLLAAPCLWPLGAAAGPFDPAPLAPAWGLPFAGILLSIALLPLLAPAFWHRHFGKVAAGWALAFLVPFAWQFGAGTAAAALLHVLVDEYLPFVILLAALFTVAGGIHIRGNLRGSPALNTAILGIGTVLASVMGTTGASMLLIRPLIRANDNRVHRAHTIVFFIFLVSNAGGALTPLGDPPLFLGFLQGVGFFWPARHILPEVLTLVGLLLLLFYAVDWYHYHHREEVRPFDPTPGTRGIAVAGARNFWLLAAIVGLVLASGIWKSGPALHVGGLAIGLPGLVRDLGLVAVTWVSLRITPAAVHEANHFSWGPMQEVAKLFAGIFLTLVPVIAILRAGSSGAFAPLIAAVTRADGSPNPAAYFWATGLLSSFLDNAPTYLVFFHTAGGDPRRLMNELAPVLAAISAGSVFMGANSYLGNAPNLMVKAIAEQRGVKMPSFFGYMAWSIAILVPIFLVLTFLYFA